MITEPLKFSHEITLKSKLDKFRVFSDQNLVVQPAQILCQFK